MKKLLSIVFLLALVLSACKRDELSFMLEGTVNDATNNTTLSGATVEVFTFPLGGTIGTKVKTLTTDGQGKFAYDLEREKYEKIEIHVRKNNYFEVIDEIPFSNLTTDGTNTYEYNLSAMSWTRFVIFNQQPVASDELKILKDSGKENCEECCANGYYYYYGEVDTVVYCPNDGNRYMKFYYWVNGNQSNGVDSVYNEPFDTTTYEFYY